MGVTGVRIGGCVGVVVLGMGRSGTSAVTGGFVEAGFWPGSRVLPANDANPAGYHENLEIVLANHRVLSDLGGSWFDPPEPNVLEGARPGVDPVLRVEFDRLLDEAGSRPVVLKDPRIGVMLPLWMPIAFGRLHPVLAIRDPVEVALSLAERDGTPVRHGLGMWEVHTTRLLDALCGLRVTVAPYAMLIEAPHQMRQVVEFAAGHIDASRGRNIDPSAAVAGVRPELHRQLRPAGEPEATLSSRQRELWRLLNGLPLGDVAINVPPALRSASPESLAAVREETRRVLSTAGS